MERRTITIRGCQLTVAEDGTVERSGRPLKPMRDRDGYLRIRFRVPGTQHSISHHGLVAMAFKGPAPEGHEVDHIDGNRANNHWRNLEYVTREENVRRAAGRSRTFRGPYKNIPQDAEQEMARLLKRGSRTLGIRALAKAFGFSPASVRGAVKRALERSTP